MISNLKIYILELLVSASLIGITILFNDFAMNYEETIKNICADCFQLNLAVVAAFIIALVAGKAFKYKGKNMKRIARGSTALLLVNSAVIIIYRILGVYGLGIVMATMVGNTVKFWSISKNILEVV